MGLMPIVVFVLIVVIGLMILRKADPHKNAVDQTVRTQKQEARRRDDRIHTSWGYSFPADYEFMPEQVRSREQLLTDFRRLLKANFGDWRIYHQVPASALEAAAHPASAPIQFLFEKDGSYKLAILVVCQNNYRDRTVVETQQICEERGIPYIRFFEEYANDDDYVVARIRNYLS